MPIESWIDRGQKRVCAILSGDLGLAEMIETLKKHFAHSRWAVPDSTICSSKGIGLVARVSPATS